MGTTISRNLRKPEATISGWLITRNLTKKNKFLEVKAVNLCEIQPHHHILEVGYGPGLGLKEAFKHVKDGPGEIHGIDLSESMVKLATRNLQQEIAANKVHLLLGSVTEMPYDSDTFHRIFHCNCYYFWPDIDAAAEELYRVIRPDGKMVCTLNYDRLKDLRAKDMMQFGNIDPDRYMNALTRHGFHHVVMKEYKDKITYQSIVATAKK